MAIKQAFELVSKDVRGDDFWVLSPLKFQNPKLAALGAERVALIAAFLTEEHSRLVSMRPEFRALARTGSHVSVSANEIELIPLGTMESMCADVHGDGMSRLHRIRGEADPGGVLIDLKDPALKQAVSDEALFETRQFTGSVAQSAFSDLHALPEVVTLVSLKQNTLVDEIREKISSLIEQSPYRSLAS
jgi:hypothetical protein